MIDRGPSPTAAAPAWTPPAEAIETVLVHLSPLAPGLEGHAYDSHSRWRWMGWVTPAQVVRRLLLRLQRRADQVSLCARESLEGIEVHDGAPPLNGCERLLAIIFDVPSAAIRLAWSAQLPSAEIERHHTDGAIVLTLKPRRAA